MTTQNSQKDGKPEASKRPTVRIGPVRIRLQHQGYIAVACHGFWRCRAIPRPSILPHTKSLKYGRYFIELEKLLQKLPDEQWLIARTAMIIGINSPVVKDIKMKLIENEPIEVFPNLIVSATTRDMVISQIHYLVNQKSNGIVHCASVDLIHHIDLIVEICERLGHNAPRLTHVYNSNKETYLALMSPENFWPEHLNIDIQEVINQGTLSTIESTSSLLNS